MSVAQSVARPIRTGLQLVSAGVIVEFFDSTIHDLTDRQYAASVALLTMVIGFLQVVLEDKSGKALLRVPSPPAPKVDVVEEAPRAEAGQVNVVTIAAVLVIIVCAIWLLQLVL